MPARPYRHSRIASAVVVLALPAMTGAVTLSEAETRSYLGSPLYLRIPVNAGADEVVDAGCFAVIGERNLATTAADYQLTLVETRAGRHLQVRGNAATNEPVIKLNVRIGCDEATRSVREFIVLLDPAPNVTPPTVGSAVSAADPATGAMRPSEGRWRVGGNDTMAAIARGIYPKLPAMQQQYIAALKRLNPAISQLDDSAALPADNPLVLPDLKALSILSLPHVAKPVKDPGPAAAPTKAAAPPPAVDSNPAAPAPKAPAPAPAAPRAKASAAKPTTKAPAEPKTDAPIPAPDKSPAAKAPAAIAPAKPAQPPAKPRDDGFHLRLSGAEIDLSRTRGVTEQQRNLLREKQLILDADDQVAALLSLKNTVKQLETRLNEMQLKLSASTQLSMKPAAPPPAVPAAVPVPAAKTPVAAAPPAAEVVLAKPAAVTKAPATPTAASPTPEVAIAPKLAPVAPTAPPAPAEPVKAKAATPASRTTANDDAFAFDSPWVLGGGAIVLLLGGGWLVWRRSQSRVYSGPLPPDAMPVAPPPSAETDVEEAFSDWAAAPVAPTEAAQPEHMSELVDATPIAPATPAEDLPPDMAAASIDEIFELDQPLAPQTIAPSATAASALDYASAASLDMELPAAESPYEKTMKFDRPLLAATPVEDSTERFEVDAGTATNVDFLVDLDEKPAEDRVRRLQYMYERYPELATGTVAINDADTVINAARLYYEDNHDPNAQGKAEELLAFAVEERPQEMRYWLAQFEVLRLERKAAEFSTLAAKFQMLYGHLDYWPKVRHIGHELDPANPLFAAAERTALAGEPFDPIGENWLNAPTDFASDALATDLRAALFRQHSVSRFDFEAINDRLLA